MTEQEQECMLDGFILGMNLAEYLNQLPLHATLQHAGLRDALRGIAGGDLTLVDGLADMKLYMPWATAETRAAIHVGTRKAAGFIEESFVLREKDAG